MFIDVTKLSDKFYSILAYIMSLDPLNRECAVFYVVFLVTQNGIPRRVS